MEKSFSDFAVEKLLELYSYHEHEIGIQHPSAVTSGLKKTDCITYAINSMEYAFSQVGDQKSAKKVRKLGKYGHELAQFLIKNQGWRTVYVTRDFWHVNGTPEEVSKHYSSLHTNQLPRNMYYENTADLPVHYFAINFSPYERPWSYHCRNIFEACASDYDGSVFARGVFNANKRDVETERDADALSFLNRVKFAFGLSKGGRHTWLFSKGYVYEVHWDGIGDGLYERTAISSWNWVANLLVVPPDEPALVNLKRNL